MNRKQILILIIISVFNTSLINAGKITLENSSIKIVFNNENGAIEQIINKNTGWIIGKRSELSLSFSMNIPMPNQRYNPVNGISQKKVIAKIDEEKKQVTFIWKKIISKNGGEFAISFKGIIELNNDGLVFRAEVDNRSDYVIESIRWPVIGDLTIPNNSKSFSQMGIEYSGMNEFEIYPKFQNEPGYFAVDNPSNWMETPTTQFVLLQNGNEGLYVEYHDTTARDLVQFKTELKPGYISTEFWDSGVNPKTNKIGGKLVRYEFSTIHFPFVNPKDKIELKPIVMKPYKGDWHKGVDIYKEWRADWFNPPIKPAWLKEVNSWQQIHLNNPEDDIRYKYSDLLDIGNECAANGVKAIQVTGWTKGGQDKENPSHDIDKRLGSWDELKNVIAKVQEMGVKIILFTKFTWADRSSDWYKNELYKFTTKDPYGEPHYYNGYAYQTDVQLAEINTRHFSPMCHLTKEWRNIADKEFTKTLLLGADGMLFDENQHHGGAKYCFDKNHGHHVPAYIFAGDELLAKGFQKIKNKINPEYIFAGEGNYDTEFREYNVSYFRVDLNHIPIHRYIAPNEEMMIAVSGYNDRNMSNTALLYRYIISYEPRNFKGRLSEFPMTLEYGKKVDAFRKKYSNFLWQGEFKHTVGAEVFSNGNIYDKYSLYEDIKTGKSAIVIANFGYDKIINVKIKFNKEIGELYTASPEESTENISDGMESIPPNSAIIIFEK